MIRTKATPARFKDLSSLILKKHLNILAMEVEQLSLSCEPHSLSSISQIGVEFGHSPRFEVH